MLEQQVITTSMIRYAEVLLIAAEAAVELGDNASATTYMNMVRARARAGGIMEKILHQVLFLLTLQELLLLMMF